MKMRLMMATAAAVVFVSQPAVSAPKDKQLGSVNFETSCTPAAQKLFNQGMLTSTRSGIAPRSAPSRRC